MSRRREKHLPAPEERLLNAAYAGDGERVRALPAQGAAWSAESDEACGLMDDACCSGDEETVQLFESLGARTSAAFPPLAYAVLRGREAEVRELLAAGNDPDEPDAEGRTPLVWAALFGQRAMAELLESAGAR